MNTADISQLIIDNILTGGNRTTAVKAREVFNAFNSSFLNKEDDLNTNGGYLGIDNFGKVDVSKIKKDTPTGQFLTDNGTWTYFVNGTGLVRASGTSISYDNSAYITLASLLTGYATAGSPSLVTSTDSVLIAFGKLQAQASNANTQIGTINTTLAGVLHTTGNESKTGVLTFVNSPVVPTPLGATDAANKAYVDASVIGLLDDRGNYTPSGSNYPSSGGSGAAGAILKGDLWTIAGVSGSAIVGTKAVSNGDVIRALQDAPSASNDAHWAIGENNLGYTALNASLASGAIYVGNGSSIGTAVTMSGDVTMTNAGVTAIGASKVTNAMLAGGIDLTSKVTNILPIANGGTATSAAATSGSVFFATTGGVFTSDYPNFIYTSGGLHVGGVNYNNTILSVTTSVTNYNGIGIGLGSTSGTTGIVSSHSNNSTAMPIGVGVAHIRLINSSTTVGAHSLITFQNGSINSAAIGSFYATTTSADFGLFLTKTAGTLDSSAIFVKGATTAVAIGFNFKTPTATLHLAGATTTQSSLRLGVASALPTGANRYGGDINFMSGRYYGYTADNTAQETFAFLSDLATAYTETITTFTSAWGASTQTLANVRYLFYFVNPSDATARTININATPTSGDLAVITDAKGDAGTNNITVNGNGKTINGDTAVVIDNDTQSISMKYNGTGWFLI
jgi:hypothetical protein